MLFSARIATNRWWFVTILIFISARCLKIPTISGKENKRNLPTKQRKNSPSLSNDALGKHKPSKPTNSKNWQKSAHSLMPSVKLMTPPESLSGRALGLDGDDRLHPCLVPGFTSSPCL